MKKVIADKLDVLLEALRSRLEEAEDFVSFEGVFEGGARRHTATIVLAAGESGGPGPLYRFTFPGGTTTGGAGHVLERLHELALQYDSAELRLMERGGGRFVSADARGVKTGSLSTTALHAIPSGLSGATAAAPRHGDDGALFAGAPVDYRVSVAEAGPLLRELGFLDPNGRLRNDKLRKYNQTDRFVDRLDPVLRDLCARHDRVLILDCACGKSYLSFVLNWYIREKLGHACRFLGLDLSEGVITASRERAARLGYRNMEFRVQDLNDYLLDPGETPQLVISLHACDTATDLAMFTGIRARADAIACVPCCQKELLSRDYRMPGLEGGLVSQGVLRARMADLLTDAMRVLLLSAAGYATTIVEYVSPLDTPKNLLVTSIRTGRPDPAAAKEYRNLVARTGAGITLGLLLDAEVGP
jgi:hypothetical protein